MKRYIEDDKGCMHVLQMTDDENPCITCSLASECGNINGMLCVYDGFHTSTLPEHYERIEE